MLFVSAVLLALYGTLAFLAGWTVYDGWNEDWRVLGVPVLLLLGIYAHFAGADRLVLSAARARTVERAEEPELHALVDRLAGMGDLPAPRIALSELDVPNAREGFSSVSSQMKWRPSSGTSSLISRIATPWS